MNNTPPESKVRLASIHLDDNALQWHLSYMMSKFNIYPSWPQYVYDVILRFGNTNEEPPYSFIQEKQTGRVQDYNGEFGSSTFKPMAVDNDYNNRSNMVQQNPTVKPIISETKRTYTASEITDKRVKGLGMIGDEPYTHGHQLKHRRNQLLVMEMVDEEPECQEAEVTKGNGLVSVGSTQLENPQLPMKALTEVSNYQTKEVSGPYNKKNAASSS